MDADKIILPEFVIAELYKESLVDLTDFSHNRKERVEENATKEAGGMTSVSPKIKYLGENGKNITIVVSEPEAMYLIEEEYAFLTNILKACRLNPADIAIINAVKQQVTYNEIKEQLKAQQILLFDVEPSLIRLPFKIPPFQIQKYDGCTIMTAPALAALNMPTQEGKLLKTKLWSSLKEIFGVG